MFIDRTLRIEKTWDENIEFHHSIKVVLDEIKENLKKENLSFTDVSTNVNGIRMLKIIIKDQGVVIHYEAIALPKNKGIKIVSGFKIPFLYKFKMVFKRKF